MQNVTVAKGGGQMAVPKAARRLAGRLTEAEW